MNKKIVIALIVLVVVTLGLRFAIFGQSPLVKLSSAPPLSGAISQSLVTSSSKSNLPVLNKDYTMIKTNYFENQDWAVAQISLNKDKNQSWVILHRLDGVHRIVLGPGTAFSNSSVSTLPKDVLTYIKDEGVIIYTPTGGQ